MEAKRRDACEGFSLFAQLVTPIVISFDEKPSGRTVNFLRENYRLSIQILEACDRPTDVTIVTKRYEL